MSSFLSTVFHFLNTKTNVVTNLNPLNSDKTSARLLLFVDSLSSVCSSGLKEFRISTL